MKWNRPSPGRETRSVASSRLGHMVYRGHNRDRLQTPPGTPLGSHRASRYLCAPQLASEDFPGSCKASRLSQTPHMVFGIFTFLWCRARPFDTFKHPRRLLLGLRGRARPPNAYRHPRCPLEAFRSLVGPRDPCRHPKCPLCYRPLKNAQSIQTRSNTYYRLRRPARIATGLWTPLGTPHDT